MSKLEEIARAIAYTVGMEPNERCIDPETALKAARAAVEAMRDPTEAMITVAYLHADYDEGVTPSQAWDSMIDAILNEKP